MKKIAQTCILLMIAILLNGCLATQLTVLKCPNDGHRLFCTKKHNEQFFACKKCNQKWYKDYSRNRTPRTRLGSPYVK